MKTWRRISAAPLDTSLTDWYTDVWFTNELSGEPGFRTFIAQHRRPNSLALITRPLGIQLFLFYEAAPTIQFSPMCIYSIAEQAISLLERLYWRGFVHRQITPQNLRIGEELFDEFRRICFLGQIPAALQYRTPGVFRRNRGSWRTIHLDNFEKATLAREWMGPRGGQPRPRPPDPFPIVPPAADIFSPMFYPKAWHDGKGT